MPDDDRSEEDDSELVGPIALDVLPVEEMNIVLPSYEDLCRAHVVSIDDPCLNLVSHHMTMMIISLGWVFGKH